MCIECFNIKIREIKEEVTRNILLRKDAILLKNRRLIDTTSKKIAEEVSRLKGQYDAIRSLSDV